MQVISASKFKQNVSVLQEALTDDILVTKENKPFVVIIDYNKYIEKYNNISNEIAIVDDGYPSISYDEAKQRVSQAIESYKNGSMETISHNEMWKNIRADCNENRI